MKLSEQYDTTKAKFYLGSSHESNILILFSDDQEVIDFGKKYFSLQEIKADMVGEGQSVNVKLAAVERVMKVRKCEI